MGTGREPYRIGLIVPSSSTTLEAELPELLRRQQQASGHRFSLHASRWRLQQATPEALPGANDSVDGAVDVLCDAQVDAIMVACPVAVMANDKPRILETQARLAARAACSGRTPAVVSSEGALVTALQALDAGTVTMIAPYGKALTDKLCEALRECGIRVMQSRSLDVADHLAVARLDTAKLLCIASQMDFSGSDALVLSACVQMPSLAVVEEAELKLGLPVISAATAGVFELLHRLDIEPQIDNAGALLRSRDRLRRKAVPPARD